MKSFEEKPMVETIEPGSRKEKYYPNLYLNIDQLPGVEKKEVGDTCMLKVKVKVKSISEDQKNKRYSLDILEGEIADKEDYGE